MNFNNRTAAIAVLVALSLLFFGVAVWVNLFFPAQGAFGNRLWDLFYMTFGGTLVILKSDATNEQSNPTPPAEPAQEQK